MNESYVSHTANMYTNSVDEQGNTYQSMSITPFFSMRKLRLVFHELAGSEHFEFLDFEAFKHHVLSSAAPQLELNRWQAIASRR